MNNNETIAREAVERASIAPADVSRETDLASKRRGRARNEKPREALAAADAAAPTSSAVASIAEHAEDVVRHAAESDVSRETRLGEREAREASIVTHAVSRETIDSNTATAHAKSGILTSDAAEAPLAPVSREAASAARDSAAASTDVVSRETGTPLRGAITVAVVNQKGGVGKTTTAVNLAASLAHIGHRVLVVDADPQGNATTGFGIDKNMLEADLFDVLIEGRPADEAIVRTSIAGLDIIPATMQLAGAELLLAERPEREYQLRAALHDATVWYDYVLIDCPPSLSLLTINALVAAASVIVPVQAEFYSLEGLAQLVAILERVRAGLNAELALSGLVVTMFDGRTRLALDVLAELETGFAGRVFATRIPRTIRLSEAPSFGKPILTFDPKSRGSEAYLELAREFHARVGAPVG